MKVWGRKSDSGNGPKIGTFLTFASPAGQNRLLRRKMKVPVLNDGDYGATEVDGCILSKTSRPVTRILAAM
jgi:hypothetical protein